MKKKINYTNEPMKMRKIKDFLPKKKVRKGWEKKNKEQISKYGADSVIIIRPDKSVLKDCQW